jgi:hypothetical protein
MFSLTCGLTPEKRGIRWPGNVLEAPLPEPVPKESKRGRPSQGYKGIGGKLEESYSRGIAGLFLPVVILIVAQCKLCIDSAAESTEVACSE